MHLIKVVDSYGGIHEVLATVDTEKMETVRDLKEQIIEQNLGLITIMPELRFNYGALNIKDMIYLG